MQNLEQTVGGWQAAQGAPTGGQVVTVFLNNAAPFSVDLGSFGKPVVTFGRIREVADQNGIFINDIVIDSPLVSRKHGRFVNSGGKWYIEDLGSVNGLIYNYQFVGAKELYDGDIIRIDDRNAARPDGALIVVSTSGSSDSWQTLQTYGAPSISIGRDPSCNIVLPHISVSKCHAFVTCENGMYFIIDNGSTNGVVLNDRRIFGKQQLFEKDIITITNSKLIFTGGAIHYCTYKRGITVDASDVVIQRKAGRKKFITCNHVNLSIKPGELVAVIGGSGAGKSTVLNAMCGYLKPASGNVYINGINLYQHFDSLKKLVGYVPQSDIVYDNLTLHDMLLYTAKLRLPEDISPAEREACIDRAIELVELPEKKNSYIKALSGGQKKRASIAVELLSDPNLLFLDEPSSGLDPGTERSLMMSLRKMADNGKTVILVTHSTLQLKLCDKIVFMGKGGNLTFYGSYDEALKFFGVDDIVDIYNMITENAPAWAQKYAATAPQRTVRQSAEQLEKKSKIPRLKQLGVLSARYAKLIINDKQRLLLLLVQAPLLAFLISLVADGNQYIKFESTQNLLFALSCCAFWVGMLNAIQEICKERSIMKREYMTGLSLTSYISSKILVLGTLCLIQSLLITGVFTLAVGLPDSGVLLPPFAELLFTTFFAALASTGMGLLVSSLFSNPDRAMTVAPILLMPQILFSGIIFALEGVTKYLSWFTVCRWSMSGYGSGAALTSLPSRSAENVQNTLESFVKTANKDLAKQFEALPGIEAPTLEAPELTVQYTDAQNEIFGIATGADENLLATIVTAWAVMLAFTVLFLVIARIVIGKIGKDRS